MNCLTDSCSCGVSEPMTSARCSAAMVAFQLQYTLAGFYVPACCHPDVLRRFLLCVSLRRYAEAGEYDSEPEREVLVGRRLHARLEECLHVRKPARRQHLLDVRSRQLTLPFFRQVVAPVGLAHTVPIMRTCVLTSRPGADVVARRTSNQRR